jgi:hypothetical protein
VPESQIFAVYCLRLAKRQPTLTVKVIRPLL